MHPTIRSRGSLIRASLIVAAFLLVNLAMGPGGARASGWEDLGTLGGSYSYATAISDSGQVVGYATTTSGETHAFLYDNGSMTDLGTLGGSYSYATDINDLGKVVGYSITTSGDTRAFLYANGSMTDLGTLGGSHSIANDINDSGQAVGTSYTTSGDKHAFLYANGSMTDLGTLGGSDSYGTGINDLGQVVGYSSTEDGDLHAFLYANGSMTDLGTLGGSSSIAYGINDSGQVVGYSTTTAGETHAFLYDNGSMTDLGTLGGSGSYATGINNSGQVVGDSYTTGGYLDAFLYDKGSMTELSSQGGSSFATDINDSGLVVGYSKTTGGGTLASLYNPENYTKYDFTCYYNNGSGDSYTGYLYAATDYQGYQVGYTQSFTDENNQEGYYKIIGETDFSGANGLAGVVYVTSYYDMENNTTYTPVSYGTAIGTNYLGSEHDYIITSGVPKYEFGKDGSTFYEADAGDYSRYDFTFYYNSGSGDYYIGYVYAPTSFQTSDPQLTVGKQLYEQPNTLWQWGYQNLNGGYYEITAVTDGFGSSYDKKSYITAYYDANTAKASLGVNSDGAATAGSIYVSDRTVNFESGYAISGANKAQFAPYTEADVTLAASLTASTAAVTSASLASTTVMTSVAAMASYTSASLTSALSGTLGLYGDQTLLDEEQYQ
jgi:probable HAF family extracellular repeat protein